MTTEPCVLVLVTVQRECGRLIHRGRDIARQNALPLHVLHVCTGKQMLGSEDSSGALNYLYGLAREADAEMDILYADSVVSTISTYAREHCAKHIIVGTAGHKHPEIDLIGSLKSSLPEASFEICDA